MLYTMHIQVNEIVKKTLGHSRVKRNPSLVKLPTPASK